MKALSVKEPYASLIAYNMKQYETRSWKTDYRGKLLIHASKTNKRIQKEYKKNERLMELASKLPALNFSKVICVADLTDCIEMTDEFINSLTEQEITCGFYSEGRYAWKLENIQLIKPIEIRGKLRLWNFDDNLIEILEG